MHRIDSAGAAVALPAAGPVGSTVGYWTAGNPTGGVPATILDQDWLNGVQEELLAVIEAAGLTASKASRVQLLAALRQSFARGLQAFTASGTFTVPAGVTKVGVQIWGAGGSGGTGSNAGATASGGGAGGYSDGVFSVTPGSGYSVTVGTGGAANGTFAGNGFGGGTSSFGALASATGGTGGVGANGIQAVTAGVGGTGSGSGALLIPGGGGGVGIVFGGGPIAGGLGGTAAFGSVPGPNVGQTASAATGQNGIYPGGGGNGGVAGGAGGAGANGLVVVRW